jgi:hypothetical protein
VRSAAQSGSIEKTRDLLVVHFRERATPCFFLDRAEVRPLADRLAAARPDWRAEATHSAADWQRYVYSDSAAASRATDLPDWNKLPLGPGRDTANQHKAHHFLFAVQLARTQAYGAQSTDALRSILDSWITATDGRPGASAYSSPLVAVHRAVALTWTWAFLSAPASQTPSSSSHSSGSSSRTRASFTRGLESRRRTTICWQMHS